MSDFVVKTSDPLKILSSSKPIVEKLKHLSFNTKNLDLVATKVVERLEKGLESLEDGFGTTGNLENDVQLIFLESCVNFCFWAEKDRPKWQIEWPQGNISTGGWYSLKKCFDRGLAKGIPILDPNYLASLSQNNVQDFFRGINGIDIPLINKRLENLVEAGTVLKEKYSGKFINVLEEAKFDAPTLAKLVSDNFSSFNDVPFFKRAQIVPNDLSYLSKSYKDFSLTNLDQLTAFADYKLPQMLRHFGVIEYSVSLAQKVDNYVLIAAGSEEEFEIRAVTIWAVELIRQKLQKYTAGEIDNALWLISQDQTGVKPYHRTYTIYY